MSTTISYKGSTIATAENQTKTLKTAGKYMEADVVVTDVTSSQGSAAGYVWQDQNGYVHLSDGGTPSSTRWVRPSDWPDLSKMDVSDGDILYMTSYADEARGFCGFSVTCTGSYTVDIGTISGSTFTIESTQTHSSGTSCYLYYGSVNGTYKVLRVTGTAIKTLSFTRSGMVTVNNFHGYGNNQGIIDIVGKLPSGISLVCSNLYNLINIQISDLTLSGSLSTMFSNCYSLMSLDVSSWNTSAVTNMNSMFSTCRALTFLDLSNWDISAVTSTSFMFSNCPSLISIDTSDWDTSAVTNMSNMFYGCYSLTSLDTSSWNTSAVTNMSSMFQNCYSLTSLDTSDWNTSKVTNMSYMFYYCYSLTSIDTSDWNTSAVTNMSYMFQNCYLLASLDVSSWDTGAVTNMNSMFSACFSLTSLDTSDWDTGAVTNMNSMFSACYSLISINTSDWDTSAVTNMNNVFSSCYSLASLDVSSWDCSLVTTATNTASMFRYCQGLHGSITLPASMTQIGTYCFADMRCIQAWHFLSTTPPILASTNAFNNMTDFGGKKIYVPSASLNAYKTANNWSTYASYMEGE